MTRNLGKDGGGRRAPSEHGSYKVRAFPHILRAIASNEEINRWQERRRFRDSHSLSRSSLVRWRRRWTPSLIPARPVFWECQKELQEAQQEICTCMLVLSCQCMYVYVVVYVER